MVVYLTATTIALATHAKTNNNNNPKKYAIINPSQPQNNIKADGDILVI